MFKRYEDLPASALLIAIALAFGLELLLRGIGPGWMAAGPLILPGLAAYGLLGLIMSWIISPIASVLRLPRPKMFGFWLGLGVVLALQSLVWVADNYGGLPLLGGTRLTATMAALAAALILAAVAGYLFSRLAGTSLGGLMKALGNLLGWIVIPMGVMVIILSPWLDWFNLEYTPKDEPQPAASKNAPGSNLILISIDTLRADALPAYGNKLVKTPNIERLLPGGRLFANLRTSAPLTLPSHAAMLTGIHPTELGIISNRGFLPKEAPTLGQIFGQAGLATGAVVSTPVLDPETGLDRSFKTYLAPYPRWSAAFYLGLKMSLGRIMEQFWGDLKPLSNSQTTGHALTWLEQNRDRRFFLFLHYWGVHDPYRPPWRFYASPRRFDGLMDRFSAAGRYRGELLYVDEQLGLLFDQLEKWGLWDKTAVILTADHGEGLGQHGYMYHAREVYEEQLRVPLIIKPAGADGKTRTEKAAIQNTMIAPLSLAAVGLAPEPPLEDTPAGAVSSGALKGALIQGNRKLIVNPAEKRWHAFDLSKDPAEKENLAQPKPPWTDLAKQLVGWLSEVTALGKEEVSQERERNLKALGYL